MFIFNPKKRAVGAYTMFIKKKGSPIKKAGEVVYETEETMDAFGDKTVTVKKDHLGNPIPKKIRFNMLNVVKNYEEEVKWADKEQYTFFENTKVDDEANWTAKNEAKEVVANLIYTEDKGHKYLEGKIGADTIRFEIVEGEESLQGFVYDTEEEAF